MPSLEVDEESSIESAGVQTGGGRDAAPVDSSQQQADPSQLRGSPTKPKMGGLTPMEGYDMAYSGGMQASPSVCAISNRRFVLPVLAPIIIMGRQSDLSRPLCLSPGP